MNNKLYKLMDWAAIEEIIYSECDHPQELLGPHVKGSNTLLQCYFPGASAVAVTWSDAENESVQTKMEIADDDGYFAQLLPTKKLLSYSYQVAYETPKKDGKTFSKKVVTVKDPYAFPCSLNEKLVTDVMENRKDASVICFGAHEETVRGVKGTRFVVLAPNAIRVSVVGAFNSFDGRICQMIRIPQTGIFELFVPDVLAGMEFQYEIKLKGDVIRIKNDPYCQLVLSERGRVSKIPGKDDFVWGDASYQKQLKKANASTRISVYSLSMNDLLDVLSLVGDFEKWSQSFAAQRKAEGFTHVQLPLLMQGAMESAYPVNFYGIEESILSVKQLQTLSNTLHVAGLGIILSWCGAGFSMAEDGMGSFDGSAVYEHQDPRQGIGAYGCCYLFQYGNVIVRNMLMRSLKDLVERFHADGISFTSVANMLYLDYDKQEGQWIPNMFGGNENLEAIDFLKSAIAIFEKEYPNVLLIAEDTSCHSLMTESQKKDGFGFHYKINYSYGDDLKSYLMIDPLYRSASHQRLTNEFVYTYVEQFILPITTAVFGDDITASFCGDEQQKAATLRAVLAYSMMHPGSLMFGASVVTANQALVTQINKLYFELPALDRAMDKADGFEWLSNMNADGCYISYVRKTDDPEEMLLMVANFAGASQSITTGVPYEGKYKELLNTDATVYGGSGTVNSQTRKAIDVQSDGRAQSITVKMAPLSVSVFQFLAYTETELAKVIEERIRRNTPIKKSKTTKK